MKSLRQAGIIRSAAVLAFLLATLGVALGTQPASVNACGFEYYWTYYAEEEMLNPVGACFNYCGGPGGCYGSTSEFRNGYSVECPCWP